MERKFLVLIRRFSLRKEQYLYFSTFGCYFLRLRGETRRFQFGCGVTHQILLCLPRPPSARTNPASRNYSLGIFNIKEKGARTRRSCACTAEDAEVADQAGASPNPSSVACATRRPRSSFLKRFALIEGPLPKKPPPIEKP